MKLFAKKARSGAADGAPAQEAASGSVRTKPRRKRKKGRWIVTVVVCLVIAAGAAYGVRYYLKSKKSSDVSVTYTAQTVKKRDISVTLTGSGTLEAAQSYSVTSLATGEILSADFEEGDAVNAGDVLYQIDTSDAESSIQSAQLSLERQQLSYNNQLKSLSNLTVTAPASGTVTELDVSVGDTVQSGAKIGTIRNSAVMSLTIPFNSTDTSAFWVGESAEVTLDSTFETLAGTITKIGSVEEVLTGNMLVKYVTIDVTNPGGITASTVGTATVAGAACNSSASFAYKDEETITAKTSGEVESVCAAEGDAVSKGDTVIQLSSDDLEQTIESSKLSLEDAENSLANKQEALDDYTITAPISGTVITKSYKAGDKLDSNSTSRTLCVIYDLSYLTMDISVDELDVSEVSVGQEVSITADAVEGKTFTGTVTKVSLVGTTSNGVTAYPVTVRIDDTDGLLPGMNVDAEIVVQSVSDVVSIPVDAVSRGNKVLVQKSGSAASDGAALEAGESGLPDGFEYADVTLGLNDEDYIQVTDGLSEGDVIAIETVVTASASSSGTAGLGILGGATGGNAAGGGGMPSGGGGGGMPSGGGGGGMPAGGGGQ